MNYDPQVRAELAVKNLIQMGDSAAPAELDFDELAAAIAGSMPDEAPKPHLPTLPDAREEAALQLAQLPDYKDNRAFAIPHAEEFDAALKDGLAKEAHVDLRIATIECITKIYCEHLKLRGAMAKALLTPKNATTKGKMNVFLGVTRPPPTIRKAAT